LAALFVKAGVTKIRFTGGEPTVGLFMTFFLSASPCDAFLATRFVSFVGLLHFQQECSNWLSFVELDFFDVALFPCGFIAL